MTQGDINAQLETALDQVEWDEPASFDEQAHQELSSQEVEQEQTAPTPTQDSFTGLDPNSLPEDAKVFYKSMQADYTRKMQELAEQRKAYEGLEQRGGPQFANQAVDFINRLEQDPQFALQVHQQLSQNLQAQGLSVAQANQAATSQIDDFMSDDSDWEDTEAWDDEEQVPAVPPEVTQRLETLQKRMDEMEEERRVMTIADELSRQTMYLRETDPSLSEDDLDRIYDLAVTTDGDLLAAHQKYDEMRNKMIANYLAKKSTISTPTVLPNGASGDEPTEFTELNDPNLARHVENILRARGL